jgi:DTW domain-containing protein YfiP
MHGSLCLCAEIPRLSTVTRLLLVIHRFEDRKPTNTGRLAALCLENSEIVVRGDAANREPPIVIPADTEPVVLFPYPGARPLEDFRGSARPVTLVVPDGNWRQASKVQKRVPGLRDLPCAVLPPGPPSVYRLRSEAHAHGMATLEAIARALEILEGRSDVRVELERVFAIAVERTLWSRGRLEQREVTTGVPEGTQRHDPRRGANAALLTRPPPR